MTRHVVFAAFLFVSSAALGCTQELADGETTESSADELRVKQLRDRSKAANIVEAHADGTARVLYSPGALYAGESPYWEAVSFQTEPGTAVQVSVQGDFPGAAEVVVTDARFRILAQGSTADGDRAALRLRAPADSKVFVRDMLWDRPMTFDIRVQKIGANR